MIIVRRGYSAENVVDSDCAKTPKIFCEILYVAKVCFYSAVCGGFSEFR